MESDHKMMVIIMVAICVVLAISLIFTDKALKTNSPYEKGDCVIHIVDEERKGTVFSNAPGDYVLVRFSPEEIPSTYVLQELKECN